MSARIFLTCPTHRERVLIAHARDAKEGWHTPVTEFDVTSPAAATYVRRIDAFLAAHGKCGNTLLDGLGREMELQYGGGEPERSGP